MALSISTSTLYFLLQEQFYHTRIHNWGEGGKENTSQFYFPITQKHMAHEFITKEARRGQVKCHQAEGAQHGGRATRNTIKGKK